MIGSTVDGLLLRPLDPSDSLEALTELVHRAYAELAAMGLRYWATHQDVQDTARRAADGECVVAVSGPALVGTLTLMPPDRADGADWYARPEVASFGQFAVEPDRQRAGIGSMLLDWAEVRAAHLGASELALDTAESAHHLIAMYQRRGYRFIDHVDWRPHVNYRSVILSKTLV